MTVTVRLIEDREDPAIRGFVHKTLLEVDGEFVPPLSQRGGAYSESFVPVESDGLVTYLNDIMQMQVLIANDDDQPAGFITFIPDHVELMIEDLGPASYVDTIAVAPAFRRRGVAKAMYECLLEMQPELGASQVTTRTWSANQQHIALLGDLGFRNVLTVPNHRGPNVDSVYFARQT